MEFLMGAGGEMAKELILATAVQKAVDSGQYVFAAVVVLMLCMELVKAFSGKKREHLRKHASKYVAGAGAVTGGLAAKASGADPVIGSVGGMMMGNAASGLYSSVFKPLIKNLPSWVSALPYLLPVLIPMGAVILGKLSKTSREKRRELLSDFDQAMKKAKSDEPSTKDLEKWISENL